MVVNKARYGMGYQPYNPKFEGFGCEVMAPTKLPEIAHNISLPVLAFGFQMTAVENILGSDRQTCVATLTLSLAIVCPIHLDGAVHARQ